MATLLAGAAALAVGSTWAPAARADSAQATVVSPGGKERPLSLDALAGGEDVIDRNYLLRSGSGDGSRTVSGFSLGAILEAASADPFGFSYLEVQRPAGDSVLLSRHQALDPSVFPDGPPVVYPTAAGTGFIRPSTGGEDLNAGDCFEAPQGLRIVLRKGVQLRVTATASPPQVKPGQPVGLHARVEGVGSGEEVSYSWTFGDGARATGAGPEVSHSFAKPGSYAVVIGVTTPGNETGASAVVRVQVGEPAGGGPDREGGGRNQRQHAPDQGVASAPLTGSSGGGASGGAIPPPASFPEPPAPAPAESSAPAEEPRRPRPEPEPEGEEVSGLLISGTATAAAEAEPQPRGQQAAARTGTPDENGGDGGLPTAAWGLLATAALLGAGALLEARGAAGLGDFAPLSGAKSPSGGGA